MSTQHHPPQIDATSILDEDEEREAAFRHIFGGESQVTVADALGVSHGTVYRVVSAYKAMTGDGAIALEHALLDQFDGTAVDPDTELMADTEPDAEPATSSVVAHCTACGDTHPVGDRPMGWATTVCPQCESTQYTSEHHTDSR